jgi:trehalose synthase
MRSLPGISPVTEVAIGSRPLSLLAPVVSDGRLVELERALLRLAERLRGRTIWHVNSTADGGGVAELLFAMLPFVHGAGLSVRWLVAGGNPEFFTLTKRVHNLLHGGMGDGGSLGEGERETYAIVSNCNARRIVTRVAAGDIVILHDPQTAGLASHLALRGAKVIWRCHIGRDSDNASTDCAWTFLRPWLTSASATVFSRAAYVPRGFPTARIIAPAIAPSSAKNCELAPDERLRALIKAGVLASEGVEDGVNDPLRHTGEISRPRPRAATPVVLQISRWDRLKDMQGVLEGFARYVAPSHPSAHLILGGPSVTGICDDPEARGVLEEVRIRWARLPCEVRDRVTLLELSMDDPATNALTVNALQRHAAVVVQKSLAEGFGLTCTEAMWKERAVVVSRVGGLSDQVVDGRSGILLDDPADLRAFGSAVLELLHNRDRAELLGAGARKRVQERFLVDSSLLAWIGLLYDVIDA